MPQIDISSSLQSPVLQIALGVVGVALLVVLLRELPRIPARLLALMATGFLDMVGVLMIVPLLPFYVQRFCGDGVPVFGVQLGVGQISGIVVSAFTVAQMISAPLWGRFSDRFGRRPALIVALAASTVAYLIFAFADSLWLLLLARVVQGAGGGTVGVIQAYVADTTAPEQRARALGWLSAATNLGVALGPVIGTLAVELGKHDLLPGAGTLRLQAAAPGLVAAMLCLCTIAFANRFLVESNAAPKTDRRPRGSTWQATWRVLAHASAPASRLILIYAIAIGSFQGVTSILALFLNARFAVTEKTIGYFYMYIGAISVFTRVLLLGRLVDRFGEAALSRLGVVILAAGLLALPFATSLATLALGVAMLPLGTAFTFPCVTALLSRVVGQQERGLYMGMQQTYGGLSRVIAPSFYGWAFDVLGISVPFYFAAGFVLLTLLLGFGLGSYGRLQQPAS